MNDRRTSKNIDDSVLCALRELGAIEDDRIEREQNAEAAAKAAAIEAKERAARAEAQRLAAQEAARTEMQLRAAIEIDAKAKAEAERDRRMAAMRAELESIQAERSLRRAEVLSRGAARVESPRRGYGMAFGLSSVLAAALAGALGMQAQRAEPVVPPVAPAVSVVEPAPVTAVPPVAPAVTAPVPEAEVAALAPVLARPHRRPIRDRDRASTTSDERQALEAELDFGDDGEGLLPGDAHRAR